MNRKDLYKGFNEVENDILERSETVFKNKKKPVWLKSNSIALLNVVIEETEDGYVARIESITIYEKITQPTK